MYNFYKMDNGLRVVLEHIDYVNSVSVGVWVENGSRNENSTNNGISHFIEHMLFKGTKTRTSKDIAEVIEGHGGQINAFTTRESTCFYTKTLDNHLEDSLDVLSDMLFNSLFDEEEIKKESKVIIEEISMSEDSPEDVVSDLHYLTIWGNDPITYPILGTEKIVKELNRDTIIRYIKSYYIPENSVISICGNLTNTNVEQLIEKYFGHWKGENNKITTYTKPEIGKAILLKNKEIEQTHISIGLKGIEVGSEDLYTLALINSYFGGGATSLLFQKLREELGLCYSIYSYVSPYINTGAISIYSAVNSKFVYEAINSISVEVKNFISTGIEETKLSKLKDQLKGNYLLGLENTMSRMFSNGKNALFLNKINSPKDIINKIDIINGEKVKDVMDKTFRHGILNAAVVGKKLKEEKLRSVLTNSFKL